MVFMLDVVMLEKMTKLQGQNHTICIKLLGQGHIWHGKTKTPEALLHGELPKRIAPV